MNFVKELAVFAVRVYIYMFIYKLIFRLTFNQASYTANPQAGNKRKQWKEAAKQFGVSVRALKKMTNDELKKLYRDMAKKVHPDAGGSDEKFNDLKDAYDFACSA